ncbi:hypothetical protein [Permianibacter aggregans]|uniref:HEAT repeat protein n=1 Tax=Permianibacter aggregans TaxID=1510150 RepID=A0A4R6USH4_9GAMM|nr:hypothetical protein [Permianibacter aggregans]QGX39881.1 hypothetical protein E2H98_09515 [Permianibacter aggregans]TDQ46314.1 hypothetical protein EV696_11499 [Permianibacter aggregans]
MKKLFVAAMVFAAGAGQLQANQPPAYSPMEMIILDALYRNDSDDARVALKVINTTNLTNTKLTDAVADHLHHTLTHSRLDNGAVIDVVAWHIKVLGNAGGRYHQFLTSVHQSSTGNKKLDKYLVEALNSSPAAEQYLPESLEMPFKKQDIESHIDAKEQCNKVEFQKISVYQPMKHVVDKVGMPFLLSTHKVKVRFSGTRDYATLHFKDCGYIMFNAPVHGETDYTVLEVGEETFSIGASKSRSQRAVSQFAAILHGLEFRTFLKLNEREFVRDTQLHDALRSRLMLNEFPSDKYADDALAIAVKLIAHNPSEESWKVIQFLSENANAEKAKDVATSILKRKK